MVPEDAAVAALPSLKDVVAKIVAAVNAEYAAKSANWPPEMKASGDKVMQIIMDEVAVVLQGDISAIQAALIAEVAKVLQSGKGPVSKSLADLA